MKTWDQITAEYRQLIEERDNLLISRRANQRRQSKDGWRSSPVPSLNLCRASGSVFGQSADRRHSFRGCCQSPPSERQQWDCRTDALQTASLGRFFTWATGAWPHPAILHGFER